MVWYETSDVPDEKWEHTFIDKGIHGGCDPKGFGDLDGDGDNDIVRGDSWFENNSGSGYSWTEHPLVPEGGSRTGKFRLALKAWVTDLDKDGDMDIVEAECDTLDTRIFGGKTKTILKNGSFILFLKILPIRIFTPWQFWILRTMVMKMYLAEVDLYQAALTNG